MVGSMNNKADHGKPALIMAANHHGGINRFGGMDLWTTTNQAWRHGGGGG